MKDPTDDRSLSTIVYFLVAVIVSLLGLVLLVSHIGSKNQSEALDSIGASLLAGGIASVGFGLLRYIDDTAERELKNQLNNMRTELEKQFDALRKAIANFAVDTAGSIRATSQADIRCVSDVEIGSKFRTEFTRFSLLPEPVAVDVLGLKLVRFLEDQLNWLVSRRHDTTVRLLLQNPYGKIFSEICELEARNLRSTQDDILRTLDKLIGATVEGPSLVWQKEQVRIEVKFYDKYQPVALFRVQDTIYVRPRVSTPQGAATRFYEVYETRDSEKHFNVQLRHFEQCWRDGRYRAPEVRELRADLESNG